MDFKTIEKEVQTILSEKRFKHSEGVAKRAVELAKVYGVDIEKARILGMVHDIAKEMSKEELYQYAEENEIQLDEIEKREPGIVHSKVGADIVKKKFGLDEQMINAIVYHTTGNVTMDLLAKVLFVADKTEEGRSYPDLEKAVAISAQDLDEAILYVCGVVINYNIKKRSLIHPDTIDLMNAIMMEKNGIFKAEK